MNRDGVYRYHNRNPPDDLTTRDHRLELIKKGDVRDALRSAVSELPDAPVYIVLSLDADDMDRRPEMALAMAGMENDIFPGANFKILSEHL